MPDSCERGSLSAELDDDALRLARSDMNAERTVQKLIELEVDRYIERSLAKMLRLAVTDRVVRDLHAEGRLLWIEVGKTKRSRRTLKVPALLRPYLLALAKDRAPDEQLISRGPTKRRRRRDRQWLRHWLQDFCDEAQIPRVCVHSLRGLHATLATEAGVSSHAVANALGHTSAAVTHAHYVQPGTQKRMSTRRVVQKLGDPNPVRRIPETIRGRSVSGGAKRLSPLLQPGESVRASGGLEAAFGLVKAREARFLDEDARSRASFRCFSRADAVTEAVTIEFPDEDHRFFADGFASPRICSRLGAGTSARSLWRSSRDLLAAIDRAHLRRIPAVCFPSW
jgi:hypothetical protein